MVGRGEVEITTPLTPLEMSLMIALLCNRALSTQDLIERVWPDADTSPEWAATGLSALVRRLKAKGVAIINTADIGYRLADPYDSRETIKERVR